MMKISVWAKANKTTARWTIAVLHTFLAFLGWLTGLLLAQIHVPFSIFSLWAAFALYTAVFLAYPTPSTLKGAKYKSPIYCLRKSCDFILAFCAYCILSLFSQHHFVAREGGFSSPFVGPLLASRGLDSSASKILQSLKYKSKNDLTHTEKKILKHEFIKQARIYTEAKLKGDNYTAAKAILILTTIVAAVGLAYLLAGLACSLSCSGAQGLAILVALAGLAGIIAGSIALIKAILQLGKKKKMEATG
jgi:hypothetical protein